MIDSNAVNLMRGGSYLDSESEYIVRSHTYHKCEHCNTPYALEELVEDWHRQSTEEHYEWICIYCKEDLEGNGLEG